MADASVGNVEQLVVLLEAKITDFEKNLAKASATATKNYAAMQKGSKSATAAMEADMVRANQSISASLAATSLKIGEVGKEFLATKVDAFSEQFMALGKSILLPLAAFTTLEGAVESFKKEIERADAAGKLSESLGLSVKSLTQLQHAAQMADVSSDELSTGLRQLAKNALDVAQGTKSGPALAFEQLGISVKTAGGQLKSTDQLFDEAAQKLSTMGNSATKTALAQQLFGRSGAALIPLLNEGRDGLKNMADESDRLGLTISGKAAAGAAELADKVKLLGDRLQGIVSTVTQDTIPAIEGAVNSINDLLGSTAGSTTIISLFEGGIREISASVVQFDGSVQQLLDDFIGLQNAWNMLTTGKGGMWSVEAWFNKGQADMDAADAKAKAILDGTYVSPKTGGEGGGTGGTGSGGSIGSTTGDAQKSKIDAVTASLQRQLDALHQTGREQAEANALAAAGITINDKAAPSIIRAADALYDQKTALEQIKKGFDEAQQLAEGFAGTLIDDLTSGKTATDSLSDAFGDLSKQLIEMAANQAIEALFSNLMGAVTGVPAAGGTAITGNIFGRGGFAA